MPRKHGLSRHAVGRAGKINDEEMEGTIRRMFFRSRSRGMGMEIDDRWVRMVSLVAEGPVCRLEGFGETAVPAGAMENGRVIRPEMLAEVLHRLWLSLQTRETRIVAAVDSRHVFVRNLMLPVMKQRDVFRAARFHFLSVVPLPLEEAVIQVSGIRPGRNDELEVTLVAVRQTRVQELTAAITRAGLKPAAVEIRPLAARRVLGIDAAPQVLVDLGNEAVHLSYFDKGQLRFARPLFSGETTGLREVGAGESPAADGPGWPQAHDLVAEIRRSLDYWSRECQHRLGLRKLVMTGTLAEDLPIAAGNNLWQADVIWGSPWTSIKAPDYLTRQELRNLERRFVVALGLAAREIKK